VQSGSRKILAGTLSDDFAAFVYDLGSDRNQPNEPCESYATDSAEDRWYRRCFALTEQQGIAMAFSMTRLEISDIILIKSDKYLDDRGYFMETYSRKSFSDLGIAAEFIQDNQSMSLRIGTLRGLHFQRSPAQQAKLVRVLLGSVFDVAVDIRPQSSTYGRWCGTSLTAQGGDQLFIPRGFAHGFVTLEPNTVVSYKVDNPYARQAESGIRWDDPSLKISWPLPDSGPILAKRDAEFPFLADLPTD
jgi:dTDP-4-dehydrorhamnose 3,5-epimerase